MKVIWTAKAKITFYGVLDYLNEKWSQKEMAQFFQKTETIINTIMKNPHIFPVSEQEMRKAVIDKNNLLIYRIDAKIKKYTFWLFLTAGKIQTKHFHKP